MEITEIKPAIISLLSGKEKEKKKMQIFAFKKSLLFLRNLHLSYSLEMI